MTSSIAAGPVHLELDDVSIEGDLHLPHEAKGLVVFAHGSGSSRFSTRNRAVARVLEEATFGTLLLDLLTPREGADDQHTAAYRFDIPLLSGRVTSVLDWIDQHAHLRTLPLALFGASTGAAAALIAAAARPRIARAVISRGGRPDLAEDALARVKAPTLLIIGGDDTPVIELNEDAKRRMRTTVEIQIVAGATHLFEEPGALEQVSTLAANWCRRYLAG